MADQFGAHDQTAEFVLVLHGLKEKNITANIRATVFQRL